jgi:hypothetical protein
MLRRPPTKITLTTEDVAAYEDNRLHETQQREQAALQAQALSRVQAQAQSTPNKSQNLRDANELNASTNAKGQAKTREERLGLGAGTSSRA